MTIPPIVYGIVVIFHFIGLAALLGGVLVQVKETIAGKGRIITAMIHGALTQLATGLLLVGFIEMVADPSTTRRSERSSQSC